MQESKVMKVPTEVFSRVSGYFRPINQWNKGKQSEFKERKKISIEVTKEIVYEEI